MPTDGVDMTEQQIAPAPRLQTGQLVLRPLVHDDLEHVTRIVGDYEVSKWLTHVPHPYTQQDALNFWDKVNQGQLGLIWAIEHAGQFCGVISIGAGLGYWICPTRWGQGLTTQAAKAAVAYHFETTDAQDLNSMYFVGNHGSARVLEKTGFSDDGPCQAFSLSQNKDVAARRMTLSRSHWERLSKSDG